MKTINWKKAQSQAQLKRISNGLHEWQEVVFSYSWDGGRYDHHLSFTSDYSIFELRNLGVAFAKQNRIFYDRLKINVIFEK